MSTFPELRALRSEVEGARLELPIGSEVYRFSKNIPMKLGMALAEAREQTRAIVTAVEAGTEPKVPDSLENISESEMRRALIGDQWDRMMADGILVDEFDAVYFTLFTWHMAGEQAALAAWTGEAGGARPPARSGSKARKTSPRSSSRKTSATTKPRRSAGRTSSQAGT